MGQHAACGVPAVYLARGTRGNSRLRPMRSISPDRRVRGRAVQPSNACSTTIPTSASKSANWLAVYKRIRYVRCPDPLFPCHRASTDRTPESGSNVRSWATNGLERPRELAQDAPVVARMQKEPERREHVDDGVEPVRPPHGEGPHVAASVVQPLARAQGAGNAQEVRRVVECIHRVASLCEEPGMAALAARHVEDARAHH